MLTQSVLRGRTEVTSTLAPTLPGKGCDKDKGERVHLVSKVM